MVRVLLPVACIWGGRAASEWQAAKKQFLRCCRFWTVWSVPEGRQEVAWRRLQQWQWTQKEMMETEEPLFLALRLTQPCTRTWWTWFLLWRLSWSGRQEEAQHLPTMQHPWFTHGLLLGGGMVSLGRALKVLESSRGVWTSNNEPQLRGV